MIKDVKETIKREAKEQKEGFLSMLLITLEASFLENLWIGKGVTAASEEAIGNKLWAQSQHTWTNYNWSRPVFLMWLNPSTNFEIQKYCQNEPKFNGVCSRNNLTKIKSGTYVVNLDGV